APARGRDLPDQPPGGGQCGGPAERLGRGSGSGTRDRLVRGQRRGRPHALLRPMTLTRCGWAESSPLMVAYHDTEWGVPVHDDRKHFEFLILDAFQAGLSWAIVLAKREKFRRAFDGFDAEKIARYRAAKLRQ